MAIIPGFSAFLETVTLLGGGDLSASTVARLLRRAPNLVVCDGAAARALEMGQIPQAVLGDLDSLDAATRARLDPATIFELADQDRTDFDKALAAIEAPLVLGAGFMGKRLDHELSCYNALVRNAGRRCILVGDHDICFHAPVSVRLDLPAGTRVSAFPMTDLEVNLRGLVWAHERLALSPMGRVGTSNAATGEGPVEIEASRTGLLIILPAAHLDVAIGACLAMPMP